MRNGSVKAFALSAMCLCLLAGCGQEDRGQTASIYAMDTVMDLTAYGEGAGEAVDAAVAEIDRLDKLLSAQGEGRDVDGQDIRRVNASTSATVSQETAALLRETLALCQETGGALDVTIYPAMEAWGFYSGEYRVPSQEELSQLEALVNYQAVEVADDGIVTHGDRVRLDLGAVGKGYAADQVARLWKNMGVTSGLLNLGGNVCCVGPKPDGSDWTVGIRDPEDENGVLCQLSGQDMAVVTSGAYQRNFERDGVRYHHILDPRTCAPARSGLASVTIVAPSGFLADGLSTAVYVMGLDSAAEFWRQRQDFDMILFTDDHQLYLTSGLAGRVTPAEGLEPQVLDG